MTLKALVKKLLVRSRISRLLYKTEWYKSLFIDADHEIYPGNAWYRKHDERNFRVVNLGSSTGKWAFDYAAVGIRGMNWAQQPQTLFEDFNLLRNFHSILDEGGYVLLTIMPFSGVNKQTNWRDAIRYLKLDTHEPIETHEIERAKEIKKHPFLLRKAALRALFRYILRTEKRYIPYPAANEGTNTMSQEALENDARMWIQGWKQQFSIADFEAPLTDENLSGREIRVRLMREVIDFCTERGYRPIYVIPPVTKHLSAYFTPIFEERYIYSFLREVNRGIPLLDYSKDIQFADDDLYFNSFFLNRRGRELFTRVVMIRLGLLPEADARESGPR